MSAVVIRQLDLWDSGQKIAVADTAARPRPNASSDVRPAYPLWTWRTGIVLPRQPKT